MDATKGAGHLAEHGVDFEAVEEFDWPSALGEADTRWDYGEVRLKALGLIGTRVYAVVYTIRRTSTWIISLRKANKKKSIHYAEKDRDPHR